MRTTKRFFVLFTSEPKLHHLIAWIGSVLVAEPNTLVQVRGKNWKAPKICCQDWRTCWRFQVLPSRVHEYTLRMRILKMIAHAYRCERAVFVMAYAMQRKPHYACAYWKWLRMRTKSILHDGATVMRRAEERRPAASSSHAEFRSGRKCEKKITSNWNEL